MSDIATKLAELKQLRNDIRAAIENKGANLPIGSPMANYAAAIEGISSGGEPIVGATNMSSMFQGSVATTLDLRLLDTSSVTSMSYMFFNSAATTLDLSGFDTSNVTNMYYMFRGSAATTLDLSSFDTSKVTNMGYMFQNSAATTLDLSSFDTSNVTSTTSMFQGSAATTGWARTQADADKFNASSGKPAGLTFYVKP